MAETKKEEAVRENEHEDEPVEGGDVLPPEEEEHVSIDAGLQPELPEVGGKKPAADGGGDTGDGKPDLLRPLTADEKALVDKAIQGLSALRFGDQQAAVRTLLEFGVRALTEIKAAAGSSDVNVRHRARTVLNEIIQTDGDGKTADAVPASKPNGGQEKVWPAEKGGERLAAARPAVPSWRQLWEREFDNQYDPPYPAAAEPGQEVFHHELFQDMQNGYFSGKRPEALEEFREKTYRYMGGDTTVEGSITDYYSQLSYVDTLKRYETARAEGNTDGRRSALADLINLQRADWCSVLVQEKIRRYLHGDENHKGQVSRLEYVSGLQEAQRQLDTSRLSAGSSFAALLNPESTPQQDAAALAHFRRAAMDGQVPRQSVEWVEQYAAAKGVQKALAGMDTPDAQKDPAKIARLKEAVESLAQLTEKCPNTRLGRMEPEQIKALLSKLAPGEGQDVAGAVKSMKDLMAAPGMVHLLQDAEALRKAPVTAQDLLMTGILGDQQRLDMLTDMTVVGDLQKSAAAFLANPASADRAAEARDGLARLLGRDHSDSGKAVVEALGGREKVETLMAALGGTDQAAKSDAARTLRSGMEDARTQKLMTLRDALADNPNLLRDAATAQKQSDDRRSTAEYAFLNLLSGDRDQTFDALKKSRDEFLTAAGASGDARLSASSDWVRTYAALRQLGAIDPNADKDTVRTQLRSTLKDLADLPETKLTNGTLAAFGGKDGLKQLLTKLDEGKDEEVLLAVRKAAENPDAQRILRDAALFKTLGRDEVLRSGGAANLDKLESLRTWAAAERLRKAADQGWRSDDDRREMAAAVGDLLDRKGTATGRQIIGAMGGEDRLTKLLGHLTKDERSEAQQDIRAIDSLARKKETIEAVGRLKKEVERGSALPDSRGVLRPDVSAEEIADAVEVHRERRLAIDTRYNDLEARFLARSPGGAEAREKALAELESFSLDSFARGGDDARLIGVPEYRSVNLILNIQETKSPQAAAQALRDLQMLANGGDSHAKALLMKLEGTGADATSVRDLLAGLESKDEQAAVRALEVMKPLLPDARTMMDEFRTRAIVRDAERSKEPTVAEMDAVAAKLKAEKDLGNQSAGRWHDWAVANRELARLTTSGGGPETVTDRQQAVAELVKLAKSGNADARQALFAFLQSGNRGDHNLGVDGRHPFVPALGHLTAAERRDLSIQALDGIKGLLESGHKLSAAETQVLATAMGRSAEEKQTHVQETARAVLDRAWQNAGARPDMMNGIFEALRQEPSVQGRRQVADLYLSHSEHPKFAEQLRSIVNWAGDHDKDAMYIIAGTLGKREDRPEVLNVVNGAVQVLGDSQSHRAELVQALLDRQRDAGDRRALLATLGDIAGRKDSNLPPEMVAAARQEIRKAFDAAVNKDGTPMPATRDTYASAVSGMMSMARHWEKQDAERAVRRITPEVAAGFAKAQANIPEGLRRQVIDGLTERRIKSGANSEEMLQALTALGHMAKHLNKADAEALIALSREQLPVAAEKAAGRCLIQIVQNGSAENKQLVASNFTESGWSRRLGAEVSQALIKYARGEDVPEALRSQISELAYDAGIRPPISHVLHMMGVTGIDQVKLKAAIDKAGGEEAFREMLGRVVAYNALPKVVQDLVRTGNTDISGINAASLIPSGANAPKLVDVKAMIDGLSAGGLPADLAFLKGSTVTDRINALNESMLNQLADRAGLGRDGLRDRLTSMRLAALTGAQTELSDRQQKVVRDQRSAKMDELVNMTLKGHETSLWWLALGAPAYLIRRADNVARFEAEQGKAVRQVEAYDRDLAKLAGEFRRVQSVNQLLDLAQDSQKLFTFNANGDRTGADLLLLRMASQHGREMLETFSPSSMVALTGVGPRAWEGGSWGRLYQNGLTDLPMAPARYQVGDPNVVADALATLKRKDLYARPAADDPNAFNERDWRLRNASHEFLVHEALRALDTHPAVAQVTQASAALTANYGEFSRLVQAGVNGHRGPDLVRHVREKVNGPEGMLKQIERIQENLPQMREVLKQLQDARKECTDLTAQAGLDRRIQAMSSVIEKFSPGSQDMQQFKAMCDLVNSGSMSESTIWKTLLEQGVPIALCIGAAALIVCTCGAATPLAALGVAAAIAASSLVIREGWAEAMYQTGFSGTGGARIGDALWRKEGFLQYDKQTGKFAVPPSVGKVLLDYGIEFGAETAMNFLLMGAGHYFSQGLRWVTGISGAAERQAAAQSLNTMLRSAGKNGQVLAETIEAQIAKGVIPAAERTFWQRYSTELIRQGGLFVGQVATEDGLRNGFEMNSTMAQITAALLLVAAHSTVSHAQTYGANGLKPRWLRPNVLEMPVDQAAFMREFEAGRTKLGADAPKTEITPLKNGNVELKVGGSRIELQFVAPEVAAARLQGQGGKTGTGTGDKTGTGTGDKTGTGDGVSRTSGTEPITREAAVAEINKLASETKLPRPVADELLARVEKGGLSPKQAAELARLHEKLGAEPFKKVMEMEAKAREFAMRMLSEGRFTPAELPVLEKLSANDHMRAITEAVLSKPAPEGTTHKQLLENLAKAELSAKAQEALNKALQEGVLPVEALQRLLATETAQFKKFAENETQRLLDLMKGFERVPAELQSAVKEFLAKKITDKEVHKAISMFSDLQKISARCSEAELSNRLRSVLEAIKPIDAEMAALKQPGVKEVFSPEEQARIQKIADAQAKLKTVDMTDPEAAAMADSFYKEFTDTAPAGVAQGKQLHIVLGLPGCGKSSAVANRLAVSERALLPDADWVKPKIDGYVAPLDGVPYPGLGNQAVHPASTKVNDAIMERALRNGDNVILQTVGRTPEGLMQTILRARALGYEVHLHDVVLDPVTSAKRTFGRSEQMPDERGVRQCIPPSYVLGVGRAPEVSFDRMTKVPGDWLLKSWHQVNNAVEFKTPPILERSSGTPPYPTVPKPVTTPAPTPAPAPVTPPAKP